ncbi:MULTISPECIES: tautomerase family protein [Cedecea]|jgi:phenylpyruvate tautomerase PptA (4-oxalocrotonate tautomerase family)|uniref:Decarboxylase n=1 Tax=Cedecea neteri TaxID=158822 RepID=A0A089PXK9_9ENTR|nr:MULTISPECIES: tautomerase family protein [Cedecea]AIR05112.1 decarboxylase [Cedecea neteri]NWC61905.1 tautomerase family protein [Cedecea sp. P7760]
MPVLHLTLLKGKNEAYLDAVSSSVQQALVEAFEVPAADLFQVFHESEKSALRFDRHYMAGPRSDNWLLIEITAGKPRSIETKKRFYQTLTEKLAAAPGIHPNDVMVVIRHNSSEDWSFGGGVASLHRE